MSFTGTTIADLLLGAGATFSVYAGGYAVAAAADPNCASVPMACPAAVAAYPCLYDPSDIPFEYYASLRDNPLYMKDFTQFGTDVSGGKLPSFSFVKAIGYLSEHPGDGDTISGGETFVQSVINTVEASPYAASTLILITWDESGGYFDHVAPPAMSTVDNEPYGPRIPLIAVGPFAAKGVVSHVQMEHSSVVTFLEWNWLGGKTGQLGTRDAVVHNIGSLLDPTKTGTAVPQ
jgi:phospholipase C